MSLAEKLHALYLLDQQVRGLSKRQDAASRRLAAQQRKLDQFQQQLNELEEQTRLAQAHAASLESESQAVEARINKLREQMNTVTTNKEYQAMLVEVNTFKADQGKLEDEAINELNRAEALSAERDAAAAQVEEQKKILAGAEQEVADAKSEVGERLAQVQGERDTAAGELPNDALQAFERQALAHDGEAMAIVHEQSRRHMEYTCGGCYMTIPVERLNALMVGRDIITDCPTCGRILYLDAEFKASMAK